MSTTDEKPPIRFRFAGKVELTAVTYLIDADSQAEAIEKAKAGDYTEIETEAAEILEVSIDTSSCEIAESDE